MIIIYGKDNCKYCELTKQYLKEKDINFKYHTIDGNLTEFLNDISFRTKNQRTIPIIFDGNQFIGGYFDICAYLG